VGGTVTYSGDSVLKGNGYTDTSQASDTIVPSAGTNAIAATATQLGSTNTGTIQWQISFYGVYL
jgi:hypothetical protein